MICRDCKLDKPEEEFNWRWKEKGIHQPVCRECERKVRHKHYESHSEEIKEKTGRDRINRRDVAQKFIYEYLSNSVCAVCGEYDFTYLTFDHVRGEKLMDISEMAAKGYSIEAIKSEILKCEVVCWNHHMEREYKRRSGGRFRRFWPRFPWEK